MAIKITEKNGKVVGIISVSEDSDLVLTTDTGRVLRTHAKSLRVMGRVTQGLCLMKIFKNEKIVSISKPGEFDDTPITEINSNENEEE